MPLTLRRSSGPSAAGIAYQLGADVTFRDIGGTGGRMVSLELEFTNSEGSGDKQRIPLDLPVPVGGTVTHRLPETVNITSGHEPVRLLVTAVAIDHDGQQFTVQAEAPLVVVAAPVAAGAVQEVTFVGAGDIANCDSAGSEATARLLDAIPGDVFTLGDNVYPNGSAEAYAKCYEPSWGRHRRRTHPNPGNHDWDVNAGAPYFMYFGASARAPYYSFNLGAWHILSLNSNISAQPGSAQYEWARADLAASGAPCTLAYWHHPLFSSGPNGNNAQMRSMWRLLDEAGVEMVLVGHDHLFERFAPQDADGRATPLGMREFVVGTGGTHLYGATSSQPNSEVRDDRTWGVLRLTLRGSDYEWQFVPVAGQSFRDFGSASCTW